MDIQKLLTIKSNKSGICYVIYKCTNQFITYYTVLNDKNTDRLYAINLPLLKTKCKEYDKLITRGVKDCIDYICR